VIGIEFKSTNFFQFPKLKCYKVYHSSFQKLSILRLDTFSLYELSTYENLDYYKTWADKIMQSLASPGFRAKFGENGNFILMHSVGSIPHGNEIDVPLNYADYYFLEALTWKKELEGK